MTPKMSSTDWTSSYSQYVARSAAISARSSNLYQLTMERVAAGQLPPTVFQDHYPRFVQAYGSEFTNRFAELGSQFLSNLVRLGSTYARQPGQASAFAEESEPHPPQFDPSNPARWYEQLAEYAGKANARAVRAYRAQLDRVAAGETTPSEAQQQSAQQMAEQLPDFMQDITRLYFELLNGLNDVRSDYEEAYFRGLLANPGREEQEAPLTITLAGPAGSLSSASLAITNTTGERTRIGCQPGDVRRLDGVGPAVIPHLQFAPDGLELDPDEEGTVTLSLLLDPEHFDTNALYAGTIHLSGGAEVPLEVGVRIFATPAPAPQAPESQAPESQAKEAKVS